MSTETAAEQLSAATHCAIVELRQYTLKPGRRDVLIDIFERHFIEAQEASGAKIIGHFRDLDDPDRFVWLRGFADMRSRQPALETFYSSDIWKAQREAVNETLVDYENVLLLRPARPGSSFRDRLRPPRDATERPASVIAATICSFDAPVSDVFIAHFHDELEPELARVGAVVAATLVTDPGENNFPALAIREGENVFVWVARFPDEATRQALERSPRWCELIESLRGRLSSPPETLRLAPAARSELA